jgi:hypothetical protein
MSLIIDAHEYAIDEFGLAWKRAANFAPRIGVSFVSELITVGMTVAMFPTPAKAFQRP